MRTLMDQIDLFDDLGDSKKGSVACDTAPFDCHQLKPVTHTRLQTEVELGYGGRDVPIWGANVMRLLLFFSVALTHKGNKTVWC